MIEVLHKFYRRLSRPPSTNYNLNSFAYDPYEMLGEKELVLDVGCKSMRGGYAFSSKAKSPRLIGLDVEPFAGVDLVADAQDLPLRSNSVDCVLCVSVLEYVPNPGLVLAEMFRALKPGGLLYVSVPFVFRYAPDPADLYRFSVQGVEVLCASFEKIQSGYNRGPASTICDLLVHFSAILFSFNNLLIYNVLIDFFQWLFFWIKYMDYWIGHYKMAHIIHNGAFFFGRKPFVLAFKS